MATLRPEPIRSYRAIVLVEIETATGYKRMAVNLANITLTLEDRGLPTFDDDLYAWEPDIHASVEGDYLGMTIWEGEWPIPPQAELQASHASIDATRNDEGHSH